jgi:2-oxoglutarate dehydrogenase E1 component
VRKVIVCTGKVYFDLYEARQDANFEDVAILRVEQLYPFPGRQLARLLRDFSNATEVVWCQEEPLNQGAWFYVQPLLRELLKPNQKLSVVARPASASPAVGYFQKHIEQLHVLIEQAFALPPVQKLAARN